MSEMQVPKGWELKKIIQVCDINPSKSEIADLSDDDLVSFIPMKNVDEKQGMIKTRDEKTLGSVRKGYTYFRNNDVIFAKITPCMENGKIAIASNLLNGIGFASTEFHVLRPHNDVLPEWIHYFLRNESFRKEAKEHFTGSAGQQRVPKDFLENHLIPIPKIHIQKKIIEKLDHILEQIEEKKKEIINQLEKNISLLETINDVKKGRSRQLTLKNHIIDKSISSIILKCTEGKGNFCFKDLVDCCTDIIDTPHSTVQYTVSGIPVIRTTNIEPNRIDFSNCKYTSNQIYEERKKKIDPKIGDVLYTREAPWGMAVKVTQEKFVVGQRILLLRPNLKKIQSDFLTLILNSSFGYDQGRSVVNKTTSEHVNIGDIKKFQIPIIPESEQHIIISKINDNLEQCSLIKEKIINSIFKQKEILRYIQLIDSSVLNSAFSGKLVN